MGQSFSSDMRPEWSQHGDRAGSEPPTSWGGHAVTRMIPEDEEVNVKTPDIQYADWKVASGASGILEDKSPLQQQTMDVPRRQRSRALSLGATHMSDFSMFPDKFEFDSTTSPMATMPKTPEPEAATPTATTPLASFTANLFRTRAASTSETVENRQEPTATTSEGKSSLQVPEPVEMRPRSASYSGRLPFFDFSMIPDKDPHYQGDARRPKRRQSVAVAEQTDMKTSATTSNISAVADGPSVVAAALTMAASRSEDPIAPVRQKSPPKSVARTRFTFFDYSMIPDKDPRAFVPPSEGKEN